MRRRSTLVAMTALVTAVATTIVLAVTSDATVNTSRCRPVRRCPTTTTSVTTTTTTTTIPSTTTTTIPSTTTMFADEFDGTNVDLTKWSPSWEFGTNVSHSSNTQAINCWNPNHVTFPGDGAAHLLLTHTPCTTGLGEQYAWTGAGLETKGKFVTPTTAHRVDVRAKLPIGWKSWPAIWSTQTGWPAAGEFDIAEGISNAPTWHTHWSGTTVDGAIPNPNDGQYHVYSVDVIPGASCFGGTMVTEIYRFDGVAIGTTNVCLAWSGQYLLLDVDACTQSWCGTPTDGTEMVIDYVRVTPTPDAGWANVVNDQFDTVGIPSHWGPYHADWASVGHSPAAYYSPSHCTANGDGYLDLLLRYEPNGVVGNTRAAWYSCTMALANGIESSPDVRVTLRWRMQPANGGVSDQNMPLRWPNSECWPQDGEEDWYEGQNPNYTSPRAFMIYGTGCTGFTGTGTPTQIAHAYPAIDLTQWHTYRLQRRTVGNDVQVATFIDDLTIPTWICNATTSPACNTTTMTPSLKHTVLQQEVPWGACPDKDDPEYNGSYCPATTASSYVDGTVDYQVDWITVDVPT